MIFNIDRIVFEFYVYLIYRIIINLNSLYISLLQLVRPVPTSMEFHLDSAEYCQAQHK